MKKKKMNIKKTIKDKTNDLMTGTTQINVRLDVQLLHDIDELAGFEKVDRMSWIRRALAREVMQADEERENSIIEDYLNFRIDDGEFEDDMGFKPPKELQEARKETMKKRITVED